jgi:hypothetical protein
MIWKSVPARILKDLRSVMKSRFCCLRKFSRHKSVQIAFDRKSTCGEMEIINELQAPFKREKKSDTLKDYE